jgi:hypothetical protein
MCGGQRLKCLSCSRRTCSMGDAMAARGSSARALLWERWGASCVGISRARFGDFVTVYSSGPSRPSSPLPRRRLAIPARPGTVAPVARGWLVSYVVMAPRSLGTVAAASNQTFIIERALLSFTSVTRCRSRRHAGTRAVKSPTQPTHILTPDTSTVHLANDAPSLSIWSFQQRSYATPASAAPPTL